MRVRGAMRSSRLDADLDLETGEEGARGAPSLTPRKRGA